MSIIKDLSELVSANIISNDTAQKISDYYSNKKTTSSNGSRQLLIFGISGALLVGIGLMFIIANQWDRLPDSIKTLCAFTILIVPQLLCIYAILKKEEKIVWRESMALLLFFAVGANISLISQIYHINGEASSFILTWMLLTVPMIYILNSSTVSLAYFIGIVSYSFAVKFDATDSSGKYIYWLLFTLPLPHYFQLFKKSPDSPLLILHHWMIPYVLTQTLGSIEHNVKGLMSLAYIFMFGVFYLIGNFSYFSERSLIKNGYRIFGFGGTVIALLVMSFESNWKSVHESHYILNSLIISPEFIVNILLLGLVLFLLFRQNKDRPLTDWKIFETTFLLYLMIFILGLFSFPAYILVNILVFGLGLAVIRDGSRQGLIGLLNLGMIIIALLVVCRSFDTGLTFVVKGILFMLVGIGFFVINWLMIRKKERK